MPQSWHSMTLSSYSISDPLSLSGTPPFPHQTSGWLKTGHRKDSIPWGALPWTQFSQGRRVLSPFSVPRPGKSSPELGVKNLPPSNTGMGSLGESRCPFFFPCPGQGGKVEPATGQPAVLCGSGVNFRSRALAARRLGCRDTMWIARRQRSVRGKVVSGLAA